jgi:hypothetical protein
MFADNMIKYVNGLVIHDPENKYVFNDLYLIVTRQQMESKQYVMALFVDNPSTLEKVIEQVKQLAKELLKLEYFHVDVDVNEFKRYYENEDGDWLINGKKEHIDNGVVVLIVDGIVVMTDGLPCYTGSFGWFIVIYHTADGEFAHAYPDSYEESMYRDIIDFDEKTATKFFKLWFSTKRYEPHRVPWE